MDLIEKLDLYMLGEKNFNFDLDSENGGKFSDDIPEKEEDAKSFEIITNTERETSENFDDCSFEGTSQGSVRDSDPAVEKLFTDCDKLSLEDTDEQSPGNSENIKSSILSDSAEEFKDCNQDELLNNSKEKDQSLEQLFLDCEKLSLGDISDNESVKFEQFLPLCSSEEESVVKPIKLHNKKEAVKMKNIIDPCVKQNDQHVTLYTNESKNEENVEINYKSVDNTSNENEIEEQHSDIKQDKVIMNKEPDLYELQDRLNLLWDKIESLQDQMKEERAFAREEALEIKQLIKQYIDVPFIENECPVADGRLKEHTIVNEDYALSKSLEENKITETVKLFSNEITTLFEQTFDPHRKENKSTNTDIPAQREDQPYRRKELFTKTFQQQRHSEALMYKRKIMEIEELCTLGTSRVANIISHLPSYKPESVQHVSSNSTPNFNDDYYNFQNDYVNSDITKQSNLNLMNNLNNIPSHCVDFGDLYKYTNV